VSLPAPRAVLCTAQKNETLCKFVAQNVCCLIHAMYELGITPPGWEDESEQSTTIRFPGVAQAI